MKRINLYTIARLAAPGVLVILAAGCSSGVMPGSADYYPPYFDTENPGSTPAVSAPLATTGPVTPVGASDYPEGPPSTATSMATPGSPASPAPAVGNSVYPESPPGTAAPQ